MKGLLYTKIHFQIPIIKYKVKLGKYFHMTLFYIFVNLIFVNFILVFSYYLRLNIFNIEYVIRIVVYKCE